ncbi:MAG TPA: lamin tail domain-containing protein [Tepidiformaceae bacterium]|nr:lamin tail domain-containing protein [Tepidiformaceae bacterium]
MGNTPGTFVPLLGAPATGAGVLRISEVMSDPAEAGKDAPYEWVELVNPSAEPVDTAGWKLGDSSRTDALPAVVVPPGGFVVVAGASAQFEAGVPVIRPASGQIGGGLGNDGDQLMLVGPDGQVVDEMSYGSNVKVFDPAPAAPARGKTLGLVDVAADPARENWRETLRPTPGEPNVFAPSAGPTAGGQASGFVGGEAGSAATVEANVEDRGLNPAWFVLGLAAAGSGGFVAAKFGPAAAGRLRRLRRSLR